MANVRPQGNARKNQKKRTAKTSGKKHEIYIDALAAMKDGKSPWRCRCGYVYPLVPEWAMGSNKVYEWLEPLKAKHEKQ